MYKQLNGLSTASLDSIKFVDQNVNIVAREKTPQAAPNFGFAADRTLVKKNLK